MLFPSLTALRRSTSWTSRSRHDQHFFLQFIVTNDAVANDDVAGAEMTRTSSAFQRIICKALDVNFLHKFYDASSLLPPRRRSHEVVPACCYRSAQISVTVFLLIFPCARRAHSGG